MLPAIAVLAATAYPPSINSRPARAEFAARDIWLGERFARPRANGTARFEPDAPRPGLVVRTNHGPILRNGRPDGRRIKLGESEFEHGLICHAPSSVVVRLPAPGARFTARAGVDANAGGGSVRFVVRVGDAVSFASETLRGGESGVPVSVDLGGAREFVIEASDAGDGIACDHADWADATVTLTDGRQIRISELPDTVPEFPRRHQASPPFSFVYGGEHSDFLLPAWSFRETKRTIASRRTLLTQTFTDPRSGVEVRCDATVYRDFPTVEWTVTVTNRGDSDSPVIQDLQALDASFQRSQTSEFLLRRFVGSLCEERDFQPIEQPLGSGAIARVSAAGGRPTNSDLCYFNIDWEDGGVIAAIGWPGQWSATFDRDTEDTLRVTTGQETTRMVLRPGESVRTPLVALQFWMGGDWLRAQNIWRRWMVTHNLPTVAGRSIPTHYGGCFGNLLPRASEEISQIQGLAADGVRLDVWFIDAGWYPCAGSWTNTGTWEPDPERFPNGLREVGEVLRKQGTQFIVWFEPERVAAGTWLAENHPEWIIGGRNGGLLDMGNPHARRWMTDRIDTIMTEAHIDVLRTDFNIDPLPYWQSADAPDRMGMTENRYVVGLLEFWDELRRRRPGMYIDTCASGGRRNDLETLRRAVPLLRSDWGAAVFGEAGAIGQQSQTYALSLWMPYHGTGCPAGDPYVMRSSYCPAFRMGWDATDPRRKPDVLRRFVNEFRSIAPLMLKDFWPLTPYSLEPTAWMAWQYHDPITGNGAVQAFRRPRADAAELRIRLRGLDARQTYLVTDADSGVSRPAKGETLMGDGLVIRSGVRPEARLITYCPTSRQKGDKTAAAREQPGIQGD